MHVIGISKQEGEKHEADGMFEDITNDNFLKLMKNLKPYI